jgi:hypothetical protein
MYYTFINFIIDHPYLILTIIVIVFILFFIKRKLYGEEEEIKPETDHPSAILDGQWILTCRQLAEKTRQYQSASLSLQELKDLLSDANRQYPDDEYIFKLYDLIEHEPKRGGFAGVSEVDWQNYQSAVENILNRFEK